MKREEPSHYAFITYTLKNMLALSFTASTTSDGNDVTPVASKAHLRKDT